MSIYIKGFEVPEIEVMNGISLCLFKSYGGDIRIRNNGTGEVFNVFPVPDHGRLIDAYALVDSFDPSDFWNPDAEDNCFAAIHVVNCASTIIPADKESEE